MNEVHSSDVIKTLISRPRPRL